MSVSAQHMASAGGLGCLLKAETEAVINTRAKEFHSCFRRAEAAAEANDDDDAHIDVSGGRIQRSLRRPASPLNNHGLTSS